VSKARLVITAVLVEGRSQSQVAREYGLSQGWVSRLLKRYMLEGDAAFEPRSRRPHTCPTRLPQTTIDLIIDIRRTLAGKGLDAGPHTIAWHLEHHYRLQVSVASISRHLAAAGLVEPTPTNGPKRPTSALPPNNPTNAGKPTSPTGLWLMAPTPKSCAGSMTTPLRPLSHRPPPRHRPHRRRAFPQNI
jgi:transposase